jgi:hypothetical protein
MRTEYISGSAAALVIGAVALTLAYTFNPFPEQPVSDAVFAETVDMGKWAACAAFMFVGSIGLTLGIVALLDVMDRHYAVLRVLSGVIFATGTIGMTGYAAVLVVLRALVLEEALELSDVNGIDTDSGVLTFISVMLGSFLLGLTLMAFGIWKGRSAPRWVPVAIWIFVATQFVPIPGNTFTVLQFVILTVAATGAAVAANDGAHDRGATTVGFRR